MKYKIESITNTIIRGDTVEELKKIPSQSVDLIFADPPYFMQTDGALIRAEGTKFSGVEDSWDKFDNYKAYDTFCEQWLSECKRILKNEGSIWVIGAFQNIYRIGYIMQNLGFWILNDVVWAKNNPVPNFKGTRFTNANETLLWCAKDKNARYTFNYKTMKQLNGGKQMRSVWNLGICIGNERLKDENGQKIHSTQKPEQLLAYVILSSSKPGQIVLDPFMGTGTTAAVAKHTLRQYIGIEREQQYIRAAEQRLESVTPDINNDLYLNIPDKKQPRVGVDKLIASGYLQTDELLYDKAGKNAVRLTPNGHVTLGKKTLSIHKMSALILDKINHNGWTYWYVKRQGQLVPIDDLRQDFRKALEL